MDNFKSKSGFVGRKTYMRTLMPDNSLKRLLSVEEAAIYMGRTPEAFRQLIHRGKIPVIRLDRRVQVDRQDLDRLIENNKSEESTF